MKISPNLGRLIVVSVIEMALAAYMLADATGLVGHSAALFYGAGGGVGAGGLCMVIFWRQWRRSLRDEAGR